jgi:hypothetical protein
MTVKNIYIFDDGMTPTNTQSLIVSNPLQFGSSRFKINLTEDEISE